MRQSVSGYKRIVVKIGASLFSSAQKGLEREIFRRIVRQVCALSAEDKEVLIVSSGAIALGMRALGLKARPRELAYLQAAASIGQNLLMDNYIECFGENKINCGQILLTWEDFDNRRRYLNAKNTLFTLLKLKSVPVINENDTISVDEIRFGDNDRLSALVAILVNADLLIILSDVDGLLDRHKEVVRVVAEIDRETKGLASPTEKKACVGGMITKLEAAKIAVDSGIPCVIANGRKEGIITDIARDASSGGKWTLFLPKKGTLAARARWIAFGTKPKGKIRVDDGARSALRNKKSLLSVGIVDIEGSFESGDIVSIIDTGGAEIARGKSGLSSSQIEKVKGIRSEKEVIHRDNIVLL